MKNKNKNTAHVHLKTLSHIHTFIQLILLVLKHLNIKYINVAVFIVNIEQSLFRLNRFFCLYHCVLSELLANAGGLSKSETNKTSFLIVIEKA